MLLTRHIWRLCHADYLRSTRGAYGELWIWRTPDGQQQFCDHVSSLHALIDAGAIGQAAPPDAIHLGAQRRE